MKDLHSIWNHRWLTPKAKTFRSPIHGLGIKAIRPIKKGEILEIISGVVVPKAEIKKYRRKMGHIGIQIEDNFFLVPTNRKEIEHTGACNHSCDPNVGFSNQVTLIAIKNISSGEELTWDYAFCESFFKPFKCKCGSKNCRKIIKPSDWKNKKIQKKYGKYFSPYLKKKMKR